MSPRLLNEHRMTITSRRETNQPLAFYSSFLLCNPAKEVRPSSAENQSDVDVNGTPTGVSFIALRGDVAAKKSDLVSGATSATWREFLGSHSRFQALNTSRMNLRLRLPATRLLSKMDRKICL